jgi:hypothetical protein
MPNVLLTPNLLAKLILMHLGEPSGLKVVRNMNREYEKTFGRKGNKQGDTLSVLKPQRFTVSHRLQYDPQPIQNIKVPVKVDQISQVAYDWDSVEKTLSLDDAVARYGRPAAIAMANDVNMRAAQFIAQQSFNWVGTPGTVPTSMATYLAAEDLMVAQGMGQNETLHCIVNRKMSSAYIDANKALFNDQRLIGQQQREGRVQNQVGYEWDIDQTIYTHTVGALGGTPLIDGTQPTSTEGNNGTTLFLFKGVGSTVTGIYKLGDKFTVAGVYSVHPQTRVSTGYLQQFSVLQDVNSVSTAATVLAAPGITPSGQYQNVNAIPADGAEVQFWAGATGTPNASAAKVFNCGLVFHRDAFTFLSVPLENPDPGMGAIVAQHRDPDTGFDLSVIRAFDGVNRKEINRVDALWGLGWLYRELATVVVGS